jgi:hypothetical protein
MMKGLVDGGLEFANPRVQDLDLQIAKLNISKDRLRLDKQYGTWGVEFPPIRQNAAMMYHSKDNVLDY